VVAVQCWSWSARPRPTADVEILTMGMRMPETCWVVFKLQVIILRNWFIWLVDSVEKLNRDLWWNIPDGGNPNHSEIKHSQYHSVYHKAQIHWSCIEPRSPQREAINRPYIEWYFFFLKKNTVYLFRNILDFMLSPCFTCNMVSFGCFPGVWLLRADVSEPSICSIFLGRSMQ
jgi:hypothetical protein